MRVVVWGAGYWGKKYIAELAGNLIGVIEPNEKTAAQVKEQYNVQVWPALPDGVKYDGAIIATPPDSHVRLAESVLKTGRYALVEKPLATSETEALILLPYRKRCMAGHIYLYHPAIEELRDVIHNGLVDHIFCRRTNDGPVRPWGDAMYDLMAHDISILNFALGLPIYVSTSGHRNWACSHIEYPGIDAMVYVSWIGGPKVRTIEVAFQNKPEIGRAHV